MTNTPTPHPAAYTPDEILALRTRYRYLRQYGVTTKDEAIDWLYVHSELNRLGYVLNSDETDWVKETEHDGHI